MPCSPFPYSPISAVLACAALTLSFIYSLVFPLGRPCVGPSSKNEKLRRQPGGGRVGPPPGARRRRRRAAGPLLGWSLTPMSLLKLKQLYNRLTRQVEETTETNRVTMEGWLHKRGEVKTSWQRRWWARPPTSTSGTTPQSSAAAPPPPPGTAPARPSSAATPVQRSQHATLARTDRRYARARCTLNSTHIKYYKNADSYNPQGEIPIESVSDVKSGRIAGLTEMNGESTDDGFVIITPERTFYFVAESNPAKFEWIQCIADEVIRFKMEGPVS